MSLAAPDVSRRPSGGVLPRSLRSSLAAVSFWAAIVLPLLYVPVVLAGIETTDGVLVFLGLVGLHLAALVGGRTYRSGPDGEVGALRRSTRTRRG